MPTTKSSPGDEPNARLYWKNDRAFGDFRSWNAWDGKLESLNRDSERCATTSKLEAAVLFGDADRRAPPQRSGERGEA